MAAVVEYADLDGTNSFYTLGNRYDFSDGWLDYVSLYNGDINTQYVVEYNISGGPWSIATLRLSGLNIALHLTDGDSSAERRIDFLRLGPGDNVIELLTTRVKHIQGYGDENNYISFGTGRVTSLELFDGDDTVYGGSGDIHSTSLGDGNNLFVSGTGRMETITTGNDNDFIDTRNSRASFIQTSGGNDVVHLGERGGLVVSLGSGDDIVFVEAAVPEWGVQIIGGAGIDTLNLSRFTSSIRIDLSDWGTWQNVGDLSGNDEPTLGYIGVTQTENVTGGQGGDTIYGDLYNNVILGMSGNDVLDAGTGTDSVLGGTGDDVIIGGRGKDRLTGNSGSDVFLFRSSAETGRTSARRDVITDFQRGIDDIDLQAIDANTLVSGNQAFSFIGSAAFTGAAGQLRFAGGIVSGDINGDKSTDFTIAVNGVSALAAGDFIL